MKNWYIVHTQTGLEDKVKVALEKMIAPENEESFIFQVIIPTEQVSEVRSGKKKISQRKFFPGYILVEMDLTEASYLYVKNIHGVTGFIGPGKKPMPLPK
ncbi:MAG: transcription termination/antitermination protein NusG, partial [Candidatus Omnitrophica bacterium]|nr:transcription termination/antitermination protein NusG [Candidatus Omnitrophota bacterium]